MALGGSVKTYSYTPVADYFIGLANFTGSFISNLKLQKLVYYAEAWHLVNYQESLVTEDFQAWVHGPAIPSLYGKYKEFGWKPIIREDLDEARWIDIVAGFDQKIQRLLSLVADEYFALDGFQLEKLTHNEEPWLKARHGLKDDEPSDRIIDKKLMQSYYSQFVNDGSES